MYCNVLAMYCLSINTYKIICEEEGKLRKTGALFQSLHCSKNVQEIS